MDSTYETTAWHGLRDGNRREKALNYAFAVAERMRDPLTVKGTVLDEKNQSLVGRIAPWDDVTLSHGYPAMILLFSELNRYDPESRWDLIAHKYLLALKEAVDNHGISTISLFGGLAGMAFAATAASHNETRYKRLIEHFDDMLAKASMSYLEAANREILMGKGVSSGMYDVIQGLSGIGRYCLTKSHNERLLMVLREILAYLVKITHPLTIEGKRIPGWYIPRDSQLMKRDKELFAKGNFNCGLAHGIPGPLALLSLAIINHVAVEGQREAILEISKWLVGAKQMDEYGSFWLDRVGFEEEESNWNVNQIYIKREAWCYGTPGVARTIYLAGTALGNEELCELALESYYAVFLRPEEEWRCHSPTFCHGFSGLLAMTVRMAEDTKDVRLQVYLDKLVDRLVSFYNPNHPLGFRDVEMMGGEVREIDKAGLLEGSAGVALALLSMSSEVEPIWDRAFLIS